jgi:Glu-tRNA(Gln) amidotransferase subunit E-like FAD-binding protein
MPLKKETDAVRNSLEEAFFAQRDSVLIENLKQMRRMEQSKEALSRVSDIRNDAVLQKLVELEVRPETLASLTVVPLVEVAWADGKIDQVEKEAVQKAVHQVLPKDATIDLELVERWLESKPPNELLTAWIHYIEGLCEELGDEERAALKKELIGQAQSVASASGGFLGLTSKVSPQERAMLDKMSSAFDKK